MTETRAHGLPPTERNQVQASDSTAGTIVTRDLLAGGYPYDQGDHRYRRSAWHIGARSHHRQQERSCEHEGLAADLKSTG